jgi:hypothetical protein
MMKLLEIGDHVAPPSDDVSERNVGAVVHSELGVTVGAVVLSVHSR